MSASQFNPLLYVIPSLAVGGAEHETVDQLNYLHKNKYKAFVIILSDKIDLYNKLELPESNILILNIKGLTTTRLKNTIKFPRALIGIHRFVIANHINTVIAVLPLSHNLMRLHQLVYRTEYRLWCFHKSMQYQATPLNTISKKIMHSINRNLSKRYDFGHIFISEAVKQNISENLRIKNGVVIHNAIHSKEVSPQLSKNYLKQHNIDLPQYLVVFPGRLHPTKGHEFFIESVGNYIKTVSPQALKIICVGGGPLKKEITQNIKASKLEKHVFITGYVDNNLMLSFIALANLVVIPSIHEGFGNVAIESLMLGKTMLTSNTGGLPEIIKIGDNGFLFEKLDKKELQEKFIKLYKNRVTLDPKILKSDFKKRFTIEAQMKNLIKVIS